MNDRLLQIFFILVSVVSYGQVNLALETDKKEYSTKDLIEVTIVLEINGTDLVRETPIQMPDLSKFYERASGSTTNVMVDPETNTSITQLIYQLVLQPKQAGTFKMGSALIRVSGKAYKTEPFDITVVDRGVAAVAKAQHDIFVNMEVKERDVYANEPTYAVLRAYSKDFNALRKVGEVAFPYPSNVEVHTVSLAKAEIEMNSRSQMHSQVIGIYMLFPKAPGRIEIPPAVIEINEPGGKEKVKTNRIALHVKKLPLDRPDGFNNAVGNFNIDVSNPSKGDPNEVNKPINVVVKMKGDGNLKSEILPIIQNSPDYKVFPPKISKNIKTGKQGLEGSIEAHYVIVPNKPGNIQIRTAAFSFFSPDHEQFVNLGEKNLALKVLTTEQVEDAKTAIEKVNDYTATVLESVPLLKTADPTKVAVVTSKSFSMILREYFPSIVFGLGILLCSVMFFKKYKTTDDVQLTTAKVETVTDVEERLRQSQVVDIKTSLVELTELLDHKKYDIYLSQFESLSKDIENQYLKSEGVSFAEYLSRHFGAQVAENYRNVKQAVRIEKYSPVHLQEDFETIHKEIKLILNQIA